MKDSVRIDRGGIEQIQSKAHAGGDLLIWTIYERPSDFLDRYVVRPFSSKNNAALTVHFDHAQLSAVRSALKRLGLIKIPREPSDDPCILESWV
jgi:hypothetical protein